MAQAPPILIYQPGGGVSSPIGSNPPVYSQQGATALVEDQEYIDVVFGSIQNDEDWVLVACEVVNTTDLEPLNIWPGIITDRTAAGFRLQLNGMPDSGNYYLSWAVSGINIEPSLATTYFLSGPVSGAPGEAVTFTVSLPPSTYVNAPVTVTPSEGGLEIGVFTPETVTLTTDSPSVTFTFTPAVYGGTTITVNNDRGLTDPDDLAFTAMADTYELSGPSGGTVGIASSNFTASLPVGGVVAGTVIVTPDDSSDGSFTPTTVELTTVAPSDTFIYTPASAGAKTISATNDGGLTDPADIIYTAVAPFVPTSIAGCKLWVKADSLALSDGALVTTWTDSSGLGNHLTNAGASYRPTYKTAIVNGKPVLRFDGVGNSFDYASMGVSQPNTWFFVAKEVNKPAQFVVMWANAGPPSGQICYLDTNGHINFAAGTAVLDAADNSGAFHIFTGIISGSNATIYVDGTLGAGPSACGALGVNAATSMGTQGGTYYPGDIAEVILYDTALGTSDREDVEDYLKEKYAIA